MGIVDQVVLPLGPGLTDPLTGTHRYLEEVAIKAAQDIVSRRVEPCKRRSEWPWWDRVAEYGLCNVSPARNAFLNYIGRQEAKKSGGHPAPAATRIIDCVRVGLRDGEADGYEAENKVGPLPCFQ
jgi:enoyl-CoA hydratase/long-chain 3-hydroxyacyl-CoA dehydrogenase